MKQVAVICFSVVSLVFAGGRQVMAQDAPGYGAGASGFVRTLVIAEDIVDFSVDNLGNIYVINSDNQLKKLSPRGDSLAV
ncbi:MAG TPA: hypothetical protein VL978_15380, partial [Puia sp.]|nr:hypothetical protein [Puia sp.]